jgi:mRNA interferase MazF
VGQWIPDRGDVVWLTFTPQAGHEQAGRRPALVISPKAYNGKVGLALLCPITSAVKGYPFEVRIEGAISGVVLADQIRSLDWRARGAVRECRASAEVVEEAIAKIETLLE